MVTIPENFMLTLARIVDEFDRDDKSIARYDNGHTLIVLTHNIQRNEFSGYRLWSQTAYIQIPVLPLTRWETLGKLHNFSALLSIT